MIEKIVPIENTQQTSKHFTPNCITVLHSMSYMHKNTSILNNGAFS